MNPQTIEEGRQAAIIAYITLIGSFAAIYMNAEKKNPYTSFHLRQAIGLNILFFAIAFIVSYFDSWMISSAFYVFFAVLWFFGLSNAFQCEHEPIPLVGDYFQKWFKSL
ncbi:membrane protein [Kordia jejudonensis]|uniref:membrane protein n=1 Tax=Kordia jejudonensis TaxID=1348245 RepID=UPI0006294AED|nr:membrane protein [Kordia jejudonensis]